MSYPCVTSVYTIKGRLNNNTFLDFLRLNLNPEILNKLITQKEDNKETPTTAILTASLKETSLKLEKDTIKLNWSIKDTMLIALYLMA
tara:strand:+ start:995 stop:1258 length:264 start_codon:yes stop_codon:yes gene_type:complete